MNRLLVTASALLLAAVPMANADEGFAAVDDGDLCAVQTAHQAVGQRAAGRAGAEDDDLGRSRDLLRRRRADRRQGRSPRREAEKLSSSGPAW